MSSNLAFKINSQFRKEEKSWMGQSEVVIGDIIVACGGSSKKYDGGSS